MLLEHGTEAPFCGVFLDEKRPGVFTCRLCGLPLFHGGTKFESGTGWPSFTQPFAEGHLKTIRDTSYGMVRTEIVCARCGVAPGPRLPRRPAADRPALLHQFGQPRRSRPPESRCPTSSAAALPKANRSKVRTEAWPIRDSASRDFRFFLLFVLLLSPP